MNEALTRPLLLIQLATTLPLVGLIWMVQLVQYPLFSSVGGDAFPVYHEGHSARITLIVVPLMLLELSAAMLFVAYRPTGLEAWQAMLGAGLIGLVWASTFLWQVPMHGRLAAGFDDGAWRSLVTGNWLRTFGWTTRGALVLFWTKHL